ncbi:LytR/AlgR family response regulator transcription factor [Verminephrobacter eiseniae]|uniref:Transcriptional regulator, LytR/AlgR family n=1 Tax=Verminephrobacter eiseniae (strain EF01-2) TaxID=391735 RepID=A1WLV9_VEREI|nr:LytTR family DNA-binding domain-containing protein [Verminephrobacter eiseniae]ABM58616.1 transcriptional regulator, LytR/AlgR family [Verminephrobacter eiseniae EF01-2]MCW5284187.1 DNA-binding response regulator [Verminephrobacter eiseniae]MCW5301894.1 DNA-binding response regulator [Verminephrobacter eiseniae]MCW8182124.1 DNA-binding response regulator [Verminephrobacter eiseniae]MCW8192365.1 DNA-binding response regulator [Verminephrobacter eiseniae]
MNILIVDDEALARSRLRSLLSDCVGSADIRRGTVAEAANAAETMALLTPTGGRAFDLVLLDIHMPGQDGLTLAHALRTLPLPPSVVFVTAHTSHAVSAFELDAVDYLTKPVRRERLLQALAKAQRKPAAATAPAPAPDLPEGETLLIQDRGRTERLPLAEVLYFKAEQKYVTVRTTTRSYILDSSLGELQARFAPHLLRIHRNALVARRAMRALEKHYDPEEGEGWAVRLQGSTELLTVSRRQVAAVRAELAR